MLPDYYYILEVTKNASPIEIKAAYRNLAKLHHPDKHGGNPEKDRLFKEINEAYSVLSHIDTKFAYDKQFAIQEEYVAQPPPQPQKSRPPPYYKPPPRPYQYAPRQAGYATTTYIYSKWTLMYGKIFVVGLIMFVVLFPIMLEYAVSNYNYKKGLEALGDKDYYAAEGYFRDAMRDLGGSSTLAAIKGAELKLAFDSPYEALIYINTGFGFAIKSADIARLYYLRGLASRNFRQMHEAAEALQNALTWHYNTDSVYTVLAPIYAYELKIYDKALASYDSLIGSDKENHDHYLNRGFCYQKLDAHNLAIADFNRFIENKGINGSVLYLKAISEMNLDQLDSACINFGRAKDMGIVNAETFIKLYCSTDSVKIIYPANPF